MNILIITYQGDVSGATNSISYLAKGLAGKGHNVFVGCRKESLLYESLQGSAVNVIAMKYKRKFDFAFIRHLKEIIIQNKVEILNAQSSWDRYSSILVKWLFRLNVKVVHTRRQTPMSMGGIFQNFLYKYGTDKIVAVSNGVKQDLIKLGLPESHIHIIYNGTPKEKYAQLNHEKTASLKEKYHISKGDFVIGCVSRRKKQEQILKALAHLDFKVKLFFLGIEKTPDLEAIISQFNINHEIHFLGNIPSRDVLNYYKLFTIHILASTMEGLSQSLLESMALEVPVIATAAAGNIDLVRHEENGLLFNDGDISSLSENIIRLYNDEALRAKLTLNGKTTAFNDFSIDKTIDNYESLFQGLLLNR